jgi:hypothetical protein
MLLATAAVDCAAVGYGQAHEDGKINYYIACTSGSVHTVPIISLELR